MPDVPNERKQRFEASLKLAGETMQSWAESQAISYGHLYLVLSGARESARLIGEVDAFIARYLAPAVVGATA